MSEAIPGMQEAPPQAEARDAAVVVLVRMGPRGLETFWLRRERTVSFAAGFYAFPGGGATWARAGILLAGDLTPVQARVALALGLGAGLRDDALRALVAGPGTEPLPARNPA
jgi:hypothetical protein